MPLILGTNSIKDTGYDVANSLRFNSGSSDYLNRTTTSPSNDRKYTFSCWVKRSSLGKQYIIADYSSSSNFSEFGFNGGDKLFAYQQDGGSTAFEVVTNRVFRDLSAWYHILYVFDSAQATDTNRIKFFVNGVEETSMSGTNYPSLNLDTRLNGNGRVYNIGQSGNNGNYFDGYLTEIVGLDNQALDPTSFGEFDSDSNIFKPKDVSGLTFGNNGYYLDFENSGSLGADVSGNGNNFTVNNLTSDDQVIDTPTLNYATWNPLDNYWSNGTLSNGNLTFLSDTTNLTYITSTIGVNSGKWYWEVEFDAKSGGSDSPIIGITSTQSTAGNQRVGNFPNDWGYSGYSPSAYVNNNTETSYGSSYTTNDIIGVALDLDNNKLYFSKNGTWQNSGDPTSGATGTGALSITDPSSTPLGFYFPAICYNNVSNTGTFNANFGSSAFSYTVPSGYYALNTKNLSEFG
jgi:hypothetical protein